MSQEFLQKIFIPFERQQNSTISGIHGTGLGMSIIKGFVDAIDGYTATRQIRELPNRFHSHIPIIAVSANAFDEDMEASYEAGMNGHLAKPIIESELLKTLGEIWFNNFFMID